MAVVGAELVLSWVWLVGMDCSTLAVALQEVWFFFRHKKTPCYRGCDAILQVVSKELQERQLNHSKDASIRSKSIYKIL